MKKITVPHLVAMIGGAVAFLFSFFDFVDFGSFGGANAWDDGLFPVTTYVALIGLLIALELALTTFANVKMFDSLVGFSRSQLRLMLAFFAALLMLGYLLMDTPDKAIGFWLMFLGAAAMLVGAILERTMKEVKTVSFGGGGGSPSSPPPPPPGGGTPPPPPPPTR